MKTILGIILVLALMISVYLIFFQRSINRQSIEQNFKKMGKLTLTSPVFNDSEFIPPKYTCDSENVNPPLTIENIPAGTKSLVLIMDDPDATGGITWDHWLIWNLNPELKAINENQVPEGAIQGRTSFGEMRYGGPCPPKGNKPHRYQFKLYALDVVLNLPAGAVKSEIEKAMTGHILEQTKLVGLYGRQ